MAFSPLSHSRFLPQLRCLLGRSCELQRRNKFNTVTRPANGSYFTSNSSRQSPPSNQPFPSPYQRHGESKPTPPPRPSGLVAWILKSPARKSAFLRIGDLLGYGSPKQIAGRRARIIYTQCSEVASGPESAFWHDVLALPPTFQSWFTITNLHVWMATVRLRALPSSHGRAFVQALIDHFFLDAESRLRAIMGKKAPERLVTQQMKILKEQWNGLNVSCDIAFIAGDKEMASTIWRNLLGARGARGIRYIDPSVLLYENQSIGETQADVSNPSTGGVVDFEGPSVNKYVLYPQLVLLLTAYVRREIAHLETVSDRIILGGEGRGLRETIEEAETLSTDEKESRTQPRVRLDEAFGFGSVKVAGEDIGVILGDHFLPMCHDQNLPSV